jgi:uncharacterized protein YraI
MKHFIRLLLILMVMITGTASALASESNPTPAEDSAHQYYPCVGAPATRLAINTTGRVTPGLPNNMRQDPYASSKRVGQIPGGSTFTVIGGPACSGNMTWWQVNYNGTIGWTPEGTGSTYWLEPYSGQSLCTASLPARLVVGGYGKVTPGAANNLRSSTSTTSTRVGQIPGGSAFRVVGGPVCAENMTWYQVNYNGIVGWTAEGKNHTYWLEPFVCAGTPAPRLVVGGWGWVTPGLPNSLRSQPSTAYTSVKLGQIPGGQSFSVMGGPVCASGYIWWQVNYNGTVGWTPEGQGSTYWLEPGS